MIKAPEDIVIIKLDKKESEPEQTKSGLLIIKNETDQPKNIGTVYAVGEGRQLKSGVRVPMEVKVGDKIMFNPGGTMKFKHDGDDYLSLYTVSILAILEGEDE
ncbi:MAG: co-chaperone GroES [Actinobacteria bacterium]|nr:co-chaperone GroES [Actinomycetota bacterium]